MIYSQLRGIGHALPGNPVSNEVLAGRLAELGIETSDQWIRERTGITQRYLADPTTTTSMLAAEAGREALAHAGLAASDIDLVIVATSTPDIIFPSTACLVQKRLGIHQGPAFDIQAVCSGFLYALATADLYIRAGKATNALVVGAEVFSRLLDWRDRSTCVLFGDGAGAVVLRAESQPGILAHRLEARGEFENILRAAGGVHGGAIQGHPFLTMEGQAVFKMAVESLESSARQVLAEAGIAPEDLGLLIPHQANMRILQMTAKRLGIPMERVVVAVDRHANTSAASVPLAMHLAHQEGRLLPGQTLLLQGVGGGFTWGSLALRLAPDFA